MPRPRCSCLLATAAHALKANILSHHSTRPQELAEAEEPAAAPAAAAAGPANKSVRQAALRQFTHLYDKLLELGFREQHVQAVLKVLPPGGATHEAALDWLCMNLPQAELPRRLAGRVRAGGGPGGGGVKVGGCC